MTLARATSQAQKTSKQNRNRKANTPARQQASKGDAGHRRSLFSWLPDRLKEEILAVLLFTLAVILSLPFVGLADGTILDQFTRLLEAIFGLAAVFAPVSAAILAVELWRADVAQERIRRLFGGAILGFSVVGLLALANDHRPRQEAGGYTGEIVTMLLDAAIGEVGAALLMFSIGLVGVFLVTGTDTSTIRWSWWRIRWAGAYRESLRAAAEESSAPPESGDTATELRDATPGGTAEMPADIAPEPEPEEPKRPVINVRKRNSANEEIRSAVEQVSQHGKKSAEVESETEGWVLPPLDLLTKYEGIEPDQADLEAKAKRIEETLESFKVEASVREIFPGPAVTLFAVEPGMGVKVSKITSLQNDLALALAAPSIRIEAPVPGMARVGIEIPNADISMVGIRDVVDSPEMAKSKAKLPLPLGRDVNGRAIIADLARMPHLLIAGATGAGKSVCINSIVGNFLLSRTPDELQMVLIDPKKVELVGFKNVPHLKGPIVTEMDKVVSALRMVLHEMERRYQLFVDLGVRNIDGYNLRREDDPSLEQLPYLVVIIDELADLMMTTPDEVETLLARLCQMARATGIHLLIATQRPSVDVLTGLIKANVQARIAFAVASVTDSRVILDMPGAERLLGSGDMLFLAPDAAKPQRIQGSYIADHDLVELVSFWRKQYSRQDFEPDWVDFDSSDITEDNDDPLMDQAIEIVRSQGTASASMLQRRLRIGYNRAARIIETMEDQGLIGPSDGSKGRTVYMDADVDD
ncbi:MAG: DNA translocase FtsK 4TM domain-containing protein [Chloroflexota bacterium]